MVLGRSWRAAGTLLWYPVSRRELRHSANPSGSYTCLCQKIMMKNHVIVSFSFMVKKKKKKYSLVSVEETAKKNVDALEYSSFSFLLRQFNIGK